MKYIRSIKEINTDNPNGRTILYMHGYGGYTWQASRQLKVLKNAGYRVIALDFILVLRSHNPQDMINLMDEVDTFVRSKKLISNDLLIVGISLGGLVGYNLLRRYPELNKLLVITGGNIALLPSKRSLRKKWKITREQLADRWQEVNMYTPTGVLKDRHMIMLLPLRDKMINPDEVADEIDLQKIQNNIKLIRTKGGHFRTIISETVLHPDRVLELIQELEA